MPEPRVLWPRFPNRQDFSLSSAANQWHGLGIRISVHIKERSMTSKCLSALLILALGLAFAKPAHAQQQCLPCGQVGPNTGPIIAAIVVTLAAVVIITVVIVHESAKKRTITGCVISGANGMTLTDEKDNRVYALSGNTAGITPGDRVKLHGKKRKSKGPDKMLLWEARDVARDFGVCQP
jgi:hypothetical protein